MAFSFPLAGHFSSEDEGDFLSFACLLSAVVVVIMTMVGGMAGECE